MGISRITDLFAANIDPLSRKSSAGNKNEETSSQKSSAEAVTFSFSSAASAKSGLEAQSELNNTAKIATLKSQIAAKSYNPDPTRVAAAIFRDLA